MQTVEIERRFILRPCSIKRFLKRHRIAYTEVPIEQFYEMADAKESRRLRRIGDRYVQTIKRGEGMVRQEQESAIDEASYLKAKASHSGYLLHKIRRIFEVDGLTYELDSFQGALKGLHILEIEFASKEAAEAFVLQEPFVSVTLAEVTHDSRFSNGALSKSMAVPLIESKTFAEQLALIDATPVSLKADTKIALEPMERCAYGVQATIYALLRTIEANRQAIVNGDEDIERLHQLRVGMRKIRALLALMEGLFLPEWLKERKRVFASLMRQTGAKRDLDIYLQMIPSYRKMVGKKYGDGLTPLEEYLRQEAQKEALRLRHFLQSHEWHVGIEQMRHFAQSPNPHGLGALAERPLIFVVTPLLKERFKKVRDQGKAIGPKSAHKRYHALRIEVKKLRYLIEFFAPIFDQKVYLKTVHHLKGLQSLLGEHQDLLTQRQRLKEFVQEAHLQAPLVRKAINRLREQLETMGDEKRAAFRPLFGAFEASRSDFMQMLCRF